jgi:hypothetical protein
MSFREIKTRLRLQEESRILVVNAPETYHQMMHQFMFDTDIRAQNMGKYDFVQVFGSNREELERLVRRISTAGKYDCLFWICYPKGGGRIKSDLKRNIIWDIAGMVGMRCVTQISIDETWSALRSRPIKMVGKQR